jgi:hypothetical protein
MTRVMAVTAALLLTLSWNGRAAAQGYGVGYTDVGPVIGFGGLGEAGLSIGGRFERAIKALPDMGNGVLGIEASFDWWSFSVGSFDWSYIGIAGTVNYHFHVEGGEWDPFLGLGLGDYIVNAPDCGPISCGSYGTGIYFVGRAGVRYFFSPAMAAYADVGAGAATFNAGIMFKLSGGDGM